MPREFGRTCAECPCRRLSIGTHRRGGLRPPVKRWRVLSEAELIQRYFMSAPRRADVVLGIGDDGAIIHAEAGHDIVVSVDTLIEGVHFPPDTPPAAVGHKSLAVNLSDLAAMGAEPAWATLSLTLPCVDENWLAAFSAGLFGLADRYQVELIGGDLTQGPLSITIQVMGSLPRGESLRRDGARAGDLIFVTGTIGDAGLGLEAVCKMRALNAASMEWCLSRLNKPSPRVDAGVKLRTVASAAIDVSDGLARDLDRILSASVVGASLDLRSIPVSAAARDAYAGQVAWPAVLTAGDDYELLFTVPPARASELTILFADADCDITRIGVVEPAAGLRFTLGGAAWKLLVPAGYDHFAGR